MILIDKNIKRHSYLITGSADGEKNTKSNVKKNLIDTHFNSKLVA